MTFEAKAVNRGHRLRHAGLDRSHSSSDHNNGQDHRPRRCPRRHCRIASLEAPVASPEPFSKEGPEAARLGPSPVGSECGTRITSAHPESRGRDQARDAVAIPPSPGPTKISSAVLRENWEAAWAHGTVKGTDCSSSRYQTSQSALWLPSHLPANLARLRPGDRQGRRAQDSCEPPSSKVGGQRSVVAVYHC